MPAILNVMLMAAAMVRLSACLDERCVVDPPSDNCNSLPVKKYYYERTSKSCQEFQYTGCYSVIKNIFDTYEDCQQVCIIGVTTTTTTTTKSTSKPATSQTPSPTSPPNICQYSIDPGEWEFFGPSPSIRYYYNHTANECNWFEYLGSGGNANNFLTPELCFESCGVVTMTTTTTTTTATTTTFTADITEGLHSSVDLLLEVIIASTAIEDTVLITSSTPPLQATPTNSNTIKQTTTASTARDVPLVTTPTTSNEGNVPRSSTTQPTPPTSTTGDVPLGRVPTTSTISSLQLTITIYTSIFVSTLFILASIIIGSIIVCVFIRYRRVTLHVHSTKSEKPKLWHSNGSTSSSSSADSPTPSAPPYSATNPSYPVI